MDGLGLFGNWGHEAIESPVFGDGLEAVARATLAAYIGPNSPTRQATSATDMARAPAESTKFDVPCATSAARRKHFTSSARVRHASSIMWVQPTQEGVEGHKQAISTLSQ